MSPKILGSKGSTPTRNQAGPGTGPGETTREEELRLLRFGQDRQTQGPNMRTQRFRSSLRDCARVFAVKGARDALRNLEAGIGAINGARPFNSHSRSMQPPTEVHQTNHLPPLQESTDRRRSLPWCIEKPCRGRRSSGTPQKKRCRT